MLILIKFKFSFSVCLRFYRLSSESLRLDHQSISDRKDIYYSSEIRPFTRTEKRVRLPFDKILSNCPKLKEFNSTACDRVCYNVNRLPCQLIYLERLTLHGWSNVKMSSSIVRRCVNLKYLDLGCIKMGRAYEFFTTDLHMIKSNQLTTLKLHGVHYSLNNLQTFMSTYGSKLQIFQYSSSLITATSSTNLPNGLMITPFDSNFFSTLIQIVFNFCPNLNQFKLVLVDHDGFGYPMSIPNLVPLEHLSSLFIESEQRGFSIDLLEIILQNCPSLEFLCIVARFLSDVRVVSLCKKYCPLIKKVNQRPVE